MEFLMSLFMTLSWKWAAILLFFYSSKLFWILWQTNVFPFHYVTAVDLYLWQLLSSSPWEQGLSLPLSKEQSGGVTLPSYVLWGFSQSSCADLHELRSWVNSSEINFLLGQRACRHIIRHGRFLQQRSLPCLSLKFQSEVDHFLNLSLCSPCYFH